MSTGLCRADVQLLKRHFKVSTAEQVWRILAPIDGVFLKNERPSSKIRPLCSLCEQWCAHLTTLIGSREHFYEQCPEIMNFVARCYAAEAATTPQKS